MKIQVPEKARFILIIAERVGYPTIVSLIFGYLYFVKFQKVIEDVASVKIEMQTLSGTAKEDREEIKREIRRLGWSSDLNRNR